MFFALFEARHAIEAGCAAAESSTQSGGHRDMIIRASCHSELGPELVCLIGAAHLSAEGGRSQIERVCHWTSSGRWVEAGASLTNLRLHLLLLLLDLSLSE